MRQMSRHPWRNPILLLAPCVLALLPVGGCGSANELNVRPGVSQYAIPFLSADPTVLVLKNLSDEDAAVTLTTYSILGGITDSDPVIVPALGELRLNLAGVPLDGWIHVETRDAATLGDLPTTGFVIPHFLVDRPGPAKEKAPACVFAGQRAALPITEVTQAVQVINNTRDSAVPTIPVTMNAVVTIYESDGDVFSTTPVVFGASEAQFPVIPVGFTGSIVVEATDDPLKAEAFTLAAREIPGSSLAFDNWVNHTFEFRDTELAVDFGQDTGGNFRDFAFVVTNANDESATFTIHEIRGPGGGAVLTLPRLIVLAAHETRYYATTTLDSRGMAFGEVHPFEDLFGDVFTSGPLQRYRFSLALGEGMILTARAFEATFYEAYMTVRTQLPSHEAVVMSIEQETSVFAGNRNWLTLTNPATAPLTVFVQSQTPQGNVQFLPDLVVPALGRLDWSPDGIVLNGLVGIREDQNDPTDTPVASYSLLFSSAGSFGLFGTREGHNASGLLVYLTPHIVELTDD